ncbi:MAG: 4-(cytidine 5'-diphospho)-2-C-methyl-D-erythritol kinase [Rickettsiales bacterium]|nr:4-(cytidine 5'-diphospho)-2-C-methyl-D-erythritol kinase [Rickettsiales bacterium]
MISFHHKFKTYAKINLFLHILGKREDNYHLLESIFYFTNCYDEISFEPSNANELEVNGRFAFKLENLKNSNLILKIYELLQKNFPQKLPNLKFTLTKNLPVSAGIGGGSANAAGVLREVNKFFELNLDNNSLQKIGLEIGADVPACVFSKPCFVEGIGEKISEIKNFTELNILLINPLIEVATKDIFAMGFDKFSKPISIEKTDFSNSNNLIKFLQNTKNDLENNAVKICPEINQIIGFLQGLEGVLIARMSGSGATCFVIFDNQENLFSAYKEVEKNFPSYWAAFSSPGRT